MTVPVSRDTGWWHRPVRVLDCLWLIPGIWALGWLLGHLANWINGYGWGMQ